MKRPILSILAIFCAAFGFDEAAAAATTLQQVEQRGTLICGANPGLPGFGAPDEKGHWSGLDVDYCRALASAIFNDPNKVKFIPLTAKDRFTALQSGEIDVLARDSTWTEQREADLGLLFTAVNYYDGQGFMVRKSANIKSALELDGASICVQQGTTTELNLADYFRSHNMKYEGVAFASGDETIKAYDTGRCDAFTTDVSQLYGQRLKLAEPDDNVILPEVISKEPLSPVVRQGDDQWYLIAVWTQFVMVDAEELGVAKANVDDELRSNDPDVRRLLGVEGDFGKSLGLSKDWGYRIIKNVGNYGEIFDRDVGQGSPLKIRRGLNALWSKGGLMYAPPIL
jgi:general L-amino acid transport system substrate-binding protein